MSVYAIKSDAGLIKVGMTNGDPSYRMASLQTGNPHVLALIAVLDTESAGVDHSILEAAIHRRLDRFRVVGEWFAAPDWLVLRVMAISFTEMTKPDLYGRWERRFGRYCRMWMVKLDRMVPKQAPLHKVCGTRHWSSQPCPATKSTAARKDGHVGKMAAGDGAHSPSEAPAPPETSGHASAKPAGTQAPPVDTKSKGGRPRIHPDRKAYKAQKERERRAKKKQQSEDQK